MSLARTSMNGLTIAWLMIVCRFPYWPIEQELVGAGFRRHL